MIILVFNLRHSIEKRSNSNNNDDNIIVSLIKMVVANVKLVASDQNNNDGEMTREFKRTTATTETRGDEIKQTVNDTISAHVTFLVCHLHVLTNNSLNAPNSL